MIFICNCNQYLCSGEVSLFMRRRVKLLIFALQILIISASLFASDNTKVAVRGSVSDPNRAAVVGATVAATRNGRTEAVTATTNSRGEFSLLLDAGEYALGVHAEGFAPVTKIISVRADESSVIAIELGLAENTASVTIVASGEYMSDVTSSGTKTSVALRDVPQSISVVGRQQLNDQLLTNVGDVVRYQPGVTAHQGENNRDQVIIRGQSSSADFFVNGVRDDVQYYRDLYNLERVEVVRGPNALVFGRGGGGGLINRVTKEAGFAPSREFTFQGGSFGDVRMTGDFNQPINDKFAFRLNGLAERSASFRDFVKFHRFGVAPTLTFVPDEKTRFTVSYEFFRDRRTADRGITSFQGKPATVPIATFYGNPDDSHVRAGVHLVSGTFERQFGDLIIRNRTLYGDYDRFYQNYVPGAANSNATLVTITAYNNATRRKNLFNQTDLIYNAETGSIRHTLLGGFEFGNQRTANFRNSGFFNNSATSIQVAFDDPTTEIPVTFRQSATDANNNLRLNLAAAYVQDQIEISRYLQVVGGLRFDRFDLKHFNNRTGDVLQRVDQLVSPRLGVVMKPVVSVSLYGSYSVSYLPSSGDQFSSLTNITLQMKPEKFENYEVGMKWDIRPNIFLTSALYRLDRTNTRSTHPNDPTRIIQTGSQRSKGFEVELNGNVTNRWSLTGGYAYQDAFISSATASTAAGKQVAQVPHHSFSIWNKYQLLRRLSAGLGVIRRSDMFAAIDNMVVLPAYTRADAAVFYSFNEKWRLQANVENVFNSRYYLNADNNTNITPGNPRAVKIGLIARF
jgi:catecholate siderophore receptor